jgi:transcription antitermination factor NusG
VLAGSSIPLFPGYVFACMTPQGRLELLQTGTLARVIPLLRPHRLLDELRQIRAALAAGADLSPCCAIERGARARIVRGPLKGVTGVVADRRIRRGRVRLILNVTMIGCGATVDHDAGDVEVVRFERGLASPRT